jgi:hypothetical protein
MILTYLWRFRIGPDKDAVGANILIGELRHTRASMGEDGVAPSDHQQEGKTEYNSQTIA